MYRLLLLSQLQTRYSSLAAAGLYNMSDIKVKHPRDCCRVLCAVSGLCVTYY